MDETYDVAVVGTGVIGLAVTAELLARGMTVAVVGPGDGNCAGQATRAAGAMLSTFAEIEPRHNAQRTAVETAERLAAHAMYPMWLERITNDGGGPLRVEPGTWVLAPAGRSGHLEPIAAAAHLAGHPAELHDPAQIPGLNPPPTSTSALWLPTEGRIDSAALMDSLTRSVRIHPRCTWRDALTRSVTAGRVGCVDDIEVHAQQVVIAAGTAIPGLLPDSGRTLGVPPILAGRGVGAVLHAPAMQGVQHVVRTPNAAFACGVHVVPGAEQTLYLAPPTGSPPPRTQIDPKPWASWPPSRVRRAPCWTPSSVPPECSPSGPGCVPIPWTTYRCSDVPASRHYCWPPPPTAAGSSSRPASPP